MLGYLCSSEISGLYLSTMSQLNGGCRGAKTINHVVPSWEMFSKNSQSVAQSTNLQR